jgi:hypothetical protein
MTHAIYLVEELVRNTCRVYVSLAFNTAVLRTIVQHADVRISTDIISDDVLRRPRTLNTYDNITYLWTPGVTLQQLINKKNPQ